MSAFEEFLEKNKTNRGTRKGAELVIPVKAFGEWAFKHSTKIAEVLRSGAEKNPKDFHRMAGHSATYFHIAEVCLGKEIVRKRLSLLSDSDNKVKR